MPEPKDFFKAICQISKAFGTTRDTNKLLDLIVTSAAKTMNVKGASLFLKKVGIDEIVSVAHYGVSEHYIKNGRTSPSKLLPILLKDGYLYSRDSTTDERLDNRDVKKQENIASILIVPMTYKGDVLGLLSVYTEKIQKFDNNHIEFLSALAEEAGMAIQEARFHERVKKNNELFFNISTNLNSSLDVKKILHIMTADIAEALNLKGVLIRLINKETNTLDLVASYGVSETFLNKGPIFVDKGLTSKETITIKNIANDNRIQHKDIMQKEGIVSMISSPIKVKDEIIGFMRLYSDVEREFIEEEIMLVNALASQGGLAIHNASMYLQIQEDKTCLEQDIWSHRLWF